MPDNKINERLSRIRIIDELFSSEVGKTFSSEEIIEHVISKNSDWNYNRFKLARDINFLRQDKNVALKEELCSSTRNKKGGRPIKKYGYGDNDSSVFHDSLTLEDKTLIRDILELLQLKGIETIRSFMKFEDHYKKDLRGYSPIISFTKNPSEKKISTRLNNLLDCIRRKKVIKIRMQDRYEITKRTTHIVHPWYLREYNRRWYLFALEGEEVIHFAVDRILSIKEMEDNKFHYRKADKSIDEILKNVIGVSFDKDAPVEEIIFWVSYKSSDFVVKKPIHETMEEVDYYSALNKVGKEIMAKIPAKKGIYLKMECIINYELKREMMSFGEELIVLYPNSLRDDIKRALGGMYRNY